MLWQYGLSHLPPFDAHTWFWVGIIFVWTGFVRTGLGFGGAALGLPLLMLIDTNVLLWLPVIAWHLLFFSSLTLSSRLHNVAWHQLRQTGTVLIIPKLIGVFGLISLPSNWITLIVLGFTLFYGLLWLFNWQLTHHKHSRWSDRLMLILGGYASGTSLVGAPLVAAVLMKQVPLHQLRDTLFVLWFILVSIKLSTLIAFDVDLQWALSLVLLPIVAVGHVLGLKAHEWLMANPTFTKQLIGGALVLMSLVVLSKSW